MLNVRTRHVSVSLALLVSLTAGEALGRKEALLNVSGGQVPTDTGSDGKTKFSIEDHKALGGKALKIAYAAGDSAGDRIAKVTNWKRFLTLELAAYNPAKETVKLTLTVKHRRTTGYATRVDVPVTLKPGKNAVRIGIDEMLNVNGTAPDLAHVVRWYLACGPGKTPTVYIGDIYLVGADAPAAAPAGRAAAGGDPQRLKRIRSATMPPVTRPVMFNTPQADAILAALEVFPPDNPWNQIVSDWPLHPRSKRMVASVGNGKPLRYNPDMGFILVPANQKRVDVKITAYPGESDKGPFPVPDSVPIEGWPVCYTRDAKVKGATLADVQRDKHNRGGDRHGIVVDPVNRMLYEFFGLRRTDAGWQAAQASVFDLKTNKLRPRGWTSADAAGLPIFPAVVRYDELKRGRIDHALRVTIRKTRRAFVAPATHYASRHTNASFPRMGERFRLRRDFDVSGFSPPVRTILTALKRYGMFVADNGIEWAISVAPDERIPVLHQELRRVRGSNFEVVVPPPLGRDPQPTRSPAGRG